MLARVHIWLCFALTFAVVPIFGQLSASFTVNNAVGCIPHVATFTDNSFGGTISYRHWDFGNGNHSNQNLSTVSASYTQSGSFTVTLTVSDGVDTALATQVVDVHANPIARIALQNTFNGCAPFTFNTIDSSAAFNSSIVSYEWSFDDGTPSSYGANIPHVYNYPGTFDLSLIVTDSLGCSGSIVLPNAVSVAAPPVATFVDTVSTVSCVPPFPVGMLNTSTGTGNLTSQWNIGNNIFSTTHLNTQLHQFGNYDVSLKVTDQYGCTDSVNVANMLQFDSANFQLFHPDTICKNMPFTITALSNYNDSVWMRINGVNKGGANITHSFYQSGNHDIWVFGENENGCIDSSLTAIWVDSIQAKFGVSATFSCQVPFPVQYTDSSYGSIASYAYRLGFGGKGSKKAVANPLVDIPVEGSFSDTLIVTSHFGCKDTAILSNHINIHVTEAAIQPSVLSGCAPLTVNFSNVSTPIDSVASAGWDYDDNSPIAFNFNQLHGSHTFTNPGEYNVKLIINTYSGCQDTANVTIRVGTPQHADFEISDTIICASSGVGFINLSSDTSLINEYVWSFGDGLSDTSSSPNHFYQDTGWLDVRLIAGYNGCYDSLEIDSGIYVKGPIVRYNSQVNCAMPNEITFSPIVMGGHTFEWNFGDGFTQNQNQQITHTYAPVDSVYGVSFYAEDSNSGCTYTYLDSVHVIYVQANVTTPTLTVCKGDFVAFDAGNSVNANQFAWQINGSGWNSGGVTKTYGLGVLGSNLIELLAVDANGCTDTAAISAVTHRPDTKFGIQQITGCDSVSAQFIDSTVSTAGIQSYLWNFGNGNMSNSFNPSETFTGNSGATFTISYTVTDTLGCWDSYTIHKGITLDYPVPSFTVTDTVLCIADSLEINHSNDTALQFLWDFGDGSTSTASFPSKGYSQSGIYPVLVTLTNAAGCDSTYGPVLVSVNDLPVVDFEVIDSVNMCFPVDVKFQAKHTDSSHVKWTWNFGDSPQNAVLNFDSAFNQYNAIGNYDVSLKVENVYGCTDSLYKQKAVQVSGPYGVLTTSPEGCLDINTAVNLKADSLTALTHNLFWDFGDGVVQTTLSSHSQVIHNYSRQGVFIANLITSNIDQSCFYVSQDTLTVSNYQANILASSPKGCIPFEFGATSGAINSNNYNWLYDGKLIGNQKDIHLTIDSYGVHNLQLIVWNDSVNCPDTASVEVWGNEQLEIEFPDDVFICEGNSITLSVDTGYTYRWGPISRVDESDKRSITVSPIKNQRYFIEVLDSNGCEAEDSVLVHVNKPIEIAEFQADTSLLPNDEITLSAIIANYAELNWDAGYSSLSCYDCLNPILSYPEPTEVTLQIIPLQGCSAIDTSFIVTTDETFTVFLPNAFSPSADGLNDVFKVQGTGIQELEYFYIYDRWGALVFETTDLEQGWDGKVQNETASANQMFTYKVKAVGPNRVAKILVGAVTVVLH